MGIFSPPKVTPPQPTPAPEEPKTDDGLEDPDSRNRARQRARDASARKNRSKLRVPLDSAVGALSGGSGLAIT